MKYKYSMQSPKTFGIESLDRGHRLRNLWGKKKTCRREKKSEHTGSLQPVAIMLAGTESKH